ncbi:hypothetical protein L7F22_025590 [Adiantum nelumboides]|nr:hypothetical protein [Adiantum nelumboides]
MSAPAFFPLQHRAETFRALLKKRVLVSSKRGRGKAVTWPPEDQICQIRLFLANDVPSSIGSTQNSMQLNCIRNATAQRSLLSAANTPPGPRGCISKRSRFMIDNEVSMTVGKPWDCPKKFACDSMWLLADGDESLELDLQKQRELRVLEAFYPRKTAVPDSPAEPAEICAAFHDNVIPTIPLVPIEEEGDDSGESEHGAKVVDNLAEQPALGKSMDACMLDFPTSKSSSMDACIPDFPTSKASSTPSQERSLHAHDSFSGSTDAKVAAAAAAAAACMAFHKHGSAKLVNADLLVEILRNPELLKSLTIFNQSSNNPALVINGLTLCSPSQLSHNQGLQYSGPPNKASMGGPHNAGLPSPVSVLSDWTQQEYAALPPTQHSMPCENVHAANNFPAVSCALVPSLPPKHSHNPSGMQEGVSGVEAAGVPGFPAPPREGRMVENVACVPNGSSLQGTPDRSCGMVARPFAPAPPPSAVNTHPKLPGRLQQSGQDHPSFQRQHQSLASLDLCRSSLPETRFRRCEKSSGPCFAMKAGHRTARVCIYFNTPRGCRNGGSCAFLHQSGSAELSALAQ